MKFILSLFTFGLLVITSCSQSVNEDNVDKNEVHETEIASELLAEIEGYEAGEEWKAYFDISIPAPMQIVEGLNRDAIAQYGYVAKMQGHQDTSVLEHYLFVIMQPKSEISGYPKELDLDLMTYRNDAVANLESSKGLKAFDVLTMNPKIDTINNVIGVKNEMLATVEKDGKPVQLYYNLGVFEGDKAFYQVMTWCLNEQKSTFQHDMNLILDSFKEK